jgi:TMEM175 potassium channel family protein
MTKGRLEAFSDGVIAIIITIMVLELKVPHGPHEADLEGLRTLGPTFAAYVLSFIYVGIYWNNHHHLFQAVRHVSGGVLWANLALLFFLSLVPFGSAWLGEAGMRPWPVAIYGLIFLLAAVAYEVLSRVLVGAHPEHGILREALGSDLKGNLSLALYTLALPLAFYVPMVSCGLYVVVAVIWLVPDRRIERKLRDHQAPHE